jgi:hypothetical protein
MVVDIANPSMPSNAGMISLSPSGSSTPAAYDVKIVGDYAFAASGTDGLSIVSINRSFLATSQVINRYKPGSGPTSGIEMYGEYLLVADGAGGMQIVDPWPGQ